MSAATDAFRQLHRSGFFVMPNPWDVGSARLLEARGFVALATTSLGLAARMGRADYGVTRDELVEHTAEIAKAVTVPLNVDSENCFPNEPGGVAACVRLLAEAGAAGCSIEDYDWQTEELLSIEAATEAVGIAAGAARESGLVLTARAENHFHGIEDLDDTIARLRAYIDAGAEVAFAPGLTAASDLARVVNEVAAPVNYVYRPNGPRLRELAALGVRRLSTGGALARLAYAAVEKGIDDILGGEPTRLPAAQLG